MHPLERYRLQHGLTLTGMAGDLGVKHPHLHRLIRGQGDPSASLIRRVVAYTKGEVTADDMVRTFSYPSRTNVNDVPESLPDGAVA